MASSRTQLDPADRVDHVTEPAEGHPEDVVGSDAGDAGDGLDQAAGAVDRGRHVDASEGAVAPFDPQVAREGEHGGAGPRSMVSRMMVSVRSPVNTSPLPVDSSRSSSGVRPSRLSEPMIST
jgi:hypothetical protein